MTGEEYDQLNAIHRKTDKDYCIWIAFESPGLPAGFRIIQHLPGWKGGISLRLHTSYPSGARWYTVPPLGSPPPVIALYNMPVISQQENITRRTSR